MAHHDEQSETPDRKPRSPKAAKVMPTIELRKDEQGNIHGKTSNGLTHTWPHDAAKKPSSCHKTFTFNGMRHSAVWVV